MGGSSSYVTTELRARDPENDTSIPTPVSSSPSTPTSSNSFKRKFEDEPPYLDISGGILANKYQRSERFEHCFSPSESPQASQYSESPVPPSPQANTTGFEMSFIMQPISFVFGKITAFTTDVWNQFKASQTSSEDDTVQAETGSTQEPTQEPTPEATPEPTPQLVSEAEPVMTAPAPKPTQSLPPVRAWNFSKNSRTAARPNIDIWAQLQATVARRDALKKKYIGRSPYKVAYEERNRRLHRVNVSKVSGSPLISSRARGEEIRRSRKPRPTRTVQDEGTQKKATEEIQRKAIEETQRKAIGDDLTLEAYLSTLRLEREANFKNYHTISQERARREEEIQRLKEQRKEPIVKPLSEATMSRVRQVIVDRERGKIIIENSKARVSLYSEDMWRLNPNPPVNHPVIDSDHKLWLNDSIIDLYLHMVAEKYNKGEEPKKAHAFGAFFWSQLLNHGPKKVEGLTRRSKVGGDNLLRLDFLFIPANFNSSHWTLGVIKPQEKRLEFYDSMKGGAAHRSQIFFRAAREYLINEIKGKAKLDQPWDQWWGEWTESFVKDCPAQTNMYDCGVFTCKHAEVLARGRELSFTQADMPTIRYRMVAEILAGELGVA